MKRRTLKENKPTEDTSTSLYDKHRPREWDSVVGQPAAVKILQDHIESGRGRQFLLTGPSGTGKTTAARIAAKEVGCNMPMEIAAAVFTGVDNMRQVQDAVKYNPMSGASARVVIIDEAHRISGQAWDSLLKALEEPSKNVYWFLLTTEFNKVPETIRTRCVKVQFKRVADDTIYNLLCDVCEAENFDTAESIIDLCVKQAKGSPREALSCLSTVANMKTRQEAAKALEDLSETEPILELCHFLMKPNGSWTKAMQLVAALEKESPESVRLAIVAYVGVAARNAKNNEQACRLLGMLDCFASPYYNAGEKFAPLLRSIGQILFAPQD